MTTGLGELVWVVDLLAHCPDVEAISVEGRSATLEVGEAWVPLVELRVHCANPAQGARLAGCLRIARVEGRVSESSFGDRHAWACWRGWAPEASTESAVTVSVVGAERVPGSPGTDVLLTDDVPATDKVGVPVGRAS